MKNKIKAFLKRNNCQWLIIFIKYPINCHEKLRRILKTDALKFKRAIFRLKRGYVVDSYLRSHETRKLQIGAGGNVLKNWLNTDLYPYEKQILPMDVTKSFFFPENTFNYVFCEHMIEHLSYLEGLNMLKECFRVLRPSGRIRISTPDLQMHLELFRNNKNELQQQYLNWISNNWLQRAGINSRDEVFVLNLMMHGWGHKFLYDFDVLESTLLEIGFSEVIRYSSGVSEDKNLKNIERHGDTIKDIKAIKKHFGSSVDNKMNDFATLVIEAKKIS